MEAVLSYVHMQVAKHCAMLYNIQKIHQGAAPHPVIRRSINGISEDNYGGMLGWKVGGDEVGV